METKIIHLSRRDFCITVSNTGYVLTYKGITIHGYGQIAGRTEVKGVVSSKKRMVYAKRAERVIQFLTFKAFRPGTTIDKVYSLIKIIEECI